VFSGSATTRTGPKNAGDLQSIGRTSRSRDTISTRRDPRRGHEGIILVATSPILPSLGEGPKPAPRPPGTPVTDRGRSRGRRRGGNRIENPAALAALAASPAPSSTPRSTASPWTRLLYVPVTRERSSSGSSGRIRAIALRRRAAASSSTGAGRRARSVLTRLDCSLETDNNHDLDVKTRNALLPRSFGRLLHFRLHEQADTRRRTGSPRNNNIDVHSIKTEDGRDLPFSHRNHELLVELPGLRRGSRSKLRFGHRHHSIDLREISSTPSRLRGYPSRLAESSAHEPLKRARSAFQAIYRRQRDRA